MKLSEKIPCFLLLTLICVSPILVAACGSERIALSTADTLRTEYVPSKPIKVKINLSNAPPLGIEAQLVCSVKSKFDAPNMEVTIELPQGFALVDGEVSWFGDITANNAIEIKSVIKSVQEGAWTIQAHARSNECSWYGDMDEIHVFVFTDSAVIGESPYPPLCERVDNPSTVDSSLSEQGIVPEAQQPNNPVNVGTKVTLTVTGRFWCYISQDSLGGHTSDSLQPMHWGNVWIYNTLGSYLGGDITGPKTGLSEGYFSIPVTNPYPLGFYVVMTPYTSACHVVKPDGSEYAGYTLYFFPSSSQTTYNIGEWRPPDLWDHTGAWRIYESIASDHYDRGAWDFMANEGPGWVPPMIKVYFKMASGHGTHIHLDQGRIDIDTEAYSKALDIAQHEYGHWVMYKIYNNWWPPGAGGIHYINRISNEPTAWTEGFADAFPLICQSYGRWEDWYFEWGEGSSYDLETCPNCDDGPACEGRVAGVLWDIFDSHNDGYDTFQDGFIAHTWYIVSHATQAKYLDFHNQWKNYGFPCEMLVLIENQNHIYIESIWFVTIKAHCNTEGTDIAVLITKDGVADGNTPQTFACACTGTHTFKVPSADGSGHPFKQWSTGSTSTTITVGSPGGTFTAYYEAPPFDFSISATPPSQTVTAGGSTTYTVTVTLTSGSTQTVSLSCSGCPPGTTCSFNPPSGNPTFSSTLTVQTSTSTPAGTYTLTITGSGGGKTHSTTVQLIVTAPTYSVTITAHCNTEGVDVAVAITMDGSPTGYNTPHTFSVTETHTFGVPATDASGHPFSQWNIGEATTTITVNSTGTYTAYYGPSFTIWTEGYKTTYHIGETMKVYVRVRNPGPALPVKAKIFLKLPSGTLYGPLLNMTVTIPANYDSGKVLWQTFTIPNAPLGTYAWIAELRNPSTNALISQYTWKWQLLAATSPQTQSISIILRAKPE